MGLILQTQSKGITAEYWNIMVYRYNKFGNTTQIEMALYANKEARNEGLGNFLESRAFSFEGMLTVPEMYAKICESKMGKKEIEPAVYEVDENGMVKMPVVIIKEAVTEDVETNEFIKAIND